MRFAFLLATLLACFIASCDGDDDLPDDAVTCAVQADCADFTDEGGMCCSGVCVDCWSDHDQDGTDDCSDPDYLDGVCQPGADLAAVAR